MLSERELNHLYDSLNFEEKLGQLLQINYGELTGLYTGKFTDEELRHAGSVLGCYSGDEILCLQKEHMKYNKVPLLFMGNVTAGYAVAQTIPLAQACSFSTELVRKLAESAAEAAVAQGMNVTFSPMVDISRDARWGRCAESYGEDVCLGSKMAVAMVEGYQGELPDASDSLSACVKHFAAYGYCEGGRDYNNVELSERTLLSTFLPAYRAAVDAGCDMMMTSFNTIGGIPVTINKKLLYDLLRKEWGFKGTIISDWNALGQCELHHAVNANEDIARLGLEATVDIVMVDRHYSEYVPQLLAAGKIPEELFKQAVMNVLRLKNKKGLLEDPYRFAKGKTDVDMDKHYQIALEGVEKSCVLLKNDGILPLPKGKKVALIGPYAVRDRAVMMWNNFSVPEAVSYRKKPYNAFSDVLDGEIIVEPGCSILEFDHFLSQADHESDPCYMNPEKYLMQAVNAAKEADIVVLMIGEHAEQSGESSSQADISLPEIQLNLMRRVYAVNQNLISVIFCGRPVDLREVTEVSKGILVAWQCGDAGMEGIANLLSGRKVPSGKLSMSFPYHSGQCPIHYDCYPTGHPSSSRRIKFTSRYIDVPNDPLYPFGYGLSYTIFEYSNIVSDCKYMTADKPLTLSVTVTNAGKYDAEEIVQFYLQDKCANMVSRPLRELKDFKRIFLKSGETKTVTFIINEEMLYFYDADCNYITEAGEYVAFIGKDCMTQNAFSFEYVK